MTQGIAILDTYDTIDAALAELDDDTAVALLERLVAKRSTAKMRAKRATVAKAKPAKEPRINKATKPVTEEPAGEDTPGKFLCECCGDRFRGPKQFGQHMKNCHWDDVLEEYALNGAHGLQVSFGVSPATSVAWAKRIEGDDA